MNNPHSNTTKTKSLSYRYSDFDDAITSTYLDEASLRDYWYASEVRILSIIRTRMVTFSIKTFADLGCGDGRLYPTYSDNLDTVFLIEPDYERLMNSVERTLGTRKRVRFASQKIQEFLPPSPLDGALCSHVLQHVPEADALRILQQIGTAVLRPGGHLFLTLAYSQREKDSYSAAWVDGGRLQGKDLSREEFDRYSRLAPPGVLLNHAFSGNSIRRMLNLAGLEAIELKAYHLECDASKPIEALLRYEDEVNLGEEVNQGCADLFVHARRISIGG